MKILQILTLLTQSGEYGGPATVASNQARELARAGHEVTLVVGVRDSYRPTPIPGVAIRAFPVRQLGTGRSFTRIVSPSMLRWLAANAARFDVAHVHLGRDLVSAPAARLLCPRIPTHVQTHGMVQQRDSIVHRLFDTALTLPILHRAAAVYFLTDREHHALCLVGGDEPAYEHLPNGVPEASERRPVPNSVPEVLFLSRLHERKRPEVFASVALDLARTHRARFTIAGPDEGMGMQIDRMLADSASDGIRRVGTVARESAVEPDRVLDRLSQADIYVLPSRREPFPMAVLEAMSIGLPVVVTESCGQAQVIADTHSGVVIDEELTGLASAIAEMLDDPELARERGRRARSAVTAHWGARDVAEQLLTHYEHSTRTTRS